MPITPTTTNTHVSNDWSELLLPGLRAVFYNTYNEMPTQYDKLFKMKTSKKAQEFELGMGNFTPWIEREGETDYVDYQKIPKGLERVYTHKEFASGFAIGKRLYEDELYSTINKMPEDLARAGRTKVETDAATVFNKAFDKVNNPIYNGNALISADHTTISGANHTNLVEGALSDTTLKAAITLMRKATDEAGKKVVFQPDVLVVPPALEWYANELIKSPHIVDSEYNNINSLAGRLKVFVYDYLDSDDAWFVLDSKRHMLNFFWRIKPAFGKSTDTDNFVAKYNGRMRYSYGASDFRGIVGSQG